MITSIWDYTRIGSQHKSSNAFMNEKSNETYHAIQINLNNKEKVYEKLALVLDIDECLIHTKFSDTNYHINKQDIYNQKEVKSNIIYNKNEIYEDCFEIFMSDGEKAVVNKRPGLDTFLDKISNQYDVYAFTAALEIYGKHVIDAIDPSNSIFKKVFYRDSCTFKKGFYLKDLKKIRTDLSKIILIDNNPISFILQPSNGIPVPSFYNYKNDKILEKLTKILDFLSKYSDVRPILHQMFRLSDLLSDHKRLFTSNDRNHIL